MADVKTLVEMVALVASGEGNPGYRPTMAPAMADLFDAAMQSIGNPTRAYRAKPAFTALRARVAARQP